MKKILLFTVVFAMFASFAFAGMPIAADQLPANIQQFIKSSFPNSEIMYAEKDHDDFDVKLNSGAEIEFYTNGEWKEIKAYQNFPEAVLPASVVSSVKKAHPQASIIKAEKTWSGYEIKTSNMMEIYITSKGKIVGQKFDD